MSLGRNVGIVLNNDSTSAPHELSKRVNARYEISIWNTELVQGCKNRTSGRLQIELQCLCSHIADFQSELVTVEHTLFPHGLWHLQRLRFLFQSRFIFTPVCLRDPQLMWSPASPTYCVTRSFFFFFLQHLPGCKRCSSSSSNSPVWCQHCWLIKAVRQSRQCVIHSYSWHMYYSPLNANN